MEGTRSSKRQGDAASVLRAFDSSSVPEKNDGGCQTDVMILSLAWVVYREVKIRACNGLGWLAGVSWQI